MIRSLVGLLAAAVASTITAATTTTAAPEEPPILGRRVEVMAEPGSLLRIGADYYEGPLVLTSSPDGVTVVETLSAEDYLLGIREVPFSWPDEALKTQAVAARTYLAFTLAGGRTALGREHGYDICATTACQVYAGRAGLASTDGRRWQQAVSDTADEILLYEGRPAQTLYSSTSGPRTRESEDIFPGLDVPYLAAVDSPVESSPYVDWAFNVSPGDLTVLLNHAGLLHGPLWSVGVETTADGAGPWMVVVSSGIETERVASYRFRSLINRAAAELMPDRYPAPRPDGRRYPQTVLSGTYTIRPVPEVIEHDGYRELTRSFAFEGQGWGHQVGMSQFGALSLAEEGIGYSDILAHYYGGLRPQPAGAWLPDVISVGLVVEADEVSLLAETGASVLIDGEPAAEPGVAVWTFRPDGNSVSTAVPIGIGTAPRVLASRMVTGPDGDILRFQLTAPGFVTITTSADGIQIGRKELGLLSGGEFEFLIGDLTAIEIVGDKRLAVGIAATSPLGSDRRVLMRVPERR